MTTHVKRLLFLSLIACPGHSICQTTSTYRITAVTFNTSNPAELDINRGRLIWKDTNPVDGSSTLRYFSGADIMSIDSGLAAFTAAIGRDYVVWNVAGRIAKAFDTRSWQSNTIAPSYNPDGMQPISIANSLVAFSQPAAGSGTTIVLHDLITGTDTLFSAGAWNTAPTVDNGELAWVASDSESANAPSNIFYSDGTTSRNLSGTTTARNRKPLLRDAQVIWLQFNADTSRVMLFTGDSVLVLAQSESPQTIITGFDASDGIAVTALEDTVAGTGTVSIFSTEAGRDTVISDPHGPSHPRISNGLVVWQSGTGVDRSVMMYRIGEGVNGSYSGGADPVVSSNIAAWISGDAVEMYAPVAIQQLTADAMNGWNQTKFKTIDSSRAVYGSFASSTKMRVFSWDGQSSKRLTDSSYSIDFLMANDGYVIWRVEADSLYYYDGINPPFKFLDTVQAENPVVSGRSIGFGGKRTADPGDTARIWLYDIANGKLTMISADPGFSGRVLPDGKTACWRSAATGLLMFYDGTSIQVLGDSMVDNDYGYRNGKIVWIDRRSGTWEVMMYDVGAKSKTVLKADTTEKANPMTDGRSAVWYENTVQDITTVTGEMWYEDINTGQRQRIGHGTYKTTFWNSMSDGKIGWLQDDGTIIAYDGEVESQMMPNDGFQSYSGVYLDHDRIIWSRAVGQSTGTNGDIFVQDLQPHVAFEAKNITGRVPLTVLFTNDSWEGGTSYSWDFGDGQTSTERNPVHTYSIPGKFSVMLTVAGRNTSSTERKYNLVRAVSTTNVDQWPITGPAEFSLLQNYPNPFNPTTVINAKWPVSSRVELVVYDVLGQLVATLADGTYPAGSYSFAFNATGLASGVYFCRLKAGRFTAVRKMTLIR